MNWLYIIILLSISIPFITSMVGYMELKAWNYNCLKKNLNKHLTCVKMHQNHLSWHPIFHAFVAFCNYEAIEKASGSVSCLLSLLLLLLHKHQQAFLEDGCLLGSTARPLQGTPKLHPKAMLLWQASSMGHTFSEVKGSSSSVMMAFWQG